MLRRSISLHLSLQTSPIRRPDEYIRVTIVFCFKSGSDEIKVATSSFDGTKGRNVQTYEKEVDKDPKTDEEHKE